MPEVNKYFSRYEPVNKKAQNAFYTGLACAREHIETEEDLERACTAMQTLAPAMAPAQNKAELFSQTMRPPYMQIWYEHTKTAARFFNHITKSKTKTKKLIETLKRIDEKNATQLLPFFIYLLEQRHKQLLEILETHSIIYALEAGFTKELDFLTDFATPITQREYNLQRITNLTTPIAQLDERIQKIFLEKLTMQTHLGIPNDLITTLDTQTHSFIDAAYLLFFLIKDNNLEKAEQKLPKLQEEEQKLQKIIQNAPLNEQQQTQFRATLEKISFQFYDLVLDVYTQLRNKKFKDILSEKFACNVRNPAKKAANSSFHNALILLKNIKGTDEEKLLRTLIRHYLEEDTYPFKRPKHAYPFTLERNQGWLQHQKNAWLKQFTQKYTVSPEQGSNIETRIHHHIEDARGILQKLNIPELLKEKNIDLQNLTTQQIIEIYQELAKESDKYDPILLGDLKTQQLALKTLQGQQHAISRETTITIEQEFDPLETMQMGNYVHGSCLNVNGSKNWSAIVNAIDANKRVLWAKENGRIIARVLIAVDDNNRIVRFPTYYATNLSLDEEFDDYIRKLAKRCKLSLNGSGQDVSNLIANRWYSDPERNI